jgi:hypothetical protein
MRTYVRDRSASRARPLPPRDRAPSPLASFVASFRCRLLAAHVISTRRETVSLSQVSVRVVSRQLALPPCHAEGRGFESLHPLHESPAPAGFLVASAVASTRSRTSFVPICAHSIALSYSRRWAPNNRSRRFVALAYTLNVKRGSVWPSHDDVCAMSSPHAHRRLAAVRRSEWNVIGSIGVMPSFASSSFARSIAAGARLDGDSTGWPSGRSSSARRGRPDGRASFCATTPVAPRGARPEGRPIARQHPSSRRRSTACRRPSHRRCANAATAPRQHGDPRRP